MQYASPIGGLRQRAKCRHANKTMVDFKQTIFQSHINTIIGSLLIGSWSLGCGLLLWHASFDQNPLANAFAKAIYNETEIQNNF